MLARAEVQESAYLDLTDEARSYGAIHGNKRAPPAVSRDLDEEGERFTSPPKDQKTHQDVGSIVAVLLLGEFISNADATLVMASTGQISSEFNSLQDANWLSTAYTLGVCSTLPMYAKLSDILGRTPLLLTAYFFLTFGCIICGTAPAMWVVILGRAISGVGGAGTMVMGSVIILDIIPTKDVAQWRAYINVAMTLGRGAGGPVGGWLTDAIGWRWLFLIQAPLIGLAALPVIFKLKIPHPLPAMTWNGLKTSIFQRIDFLGTGVLTAAVTATVLLVDQGGKSFSWLSWLSCSLSVASVILMASFGYIEMYIAREPIFDLRVLRRPNVLASYLVGSLQIAAQVGIMFSVPLYFEVTKHASTVEAGAHLVPAVLGNAIGGLCAGLFARWTGRYKTLLIMGTVIASSTYMLLWLRWNGHTSFWESLYVIPGGVGTGISSTAAFVLMTSFLELEEMPTVTGGYFLLHTFFMTVSITGTNTILGFEFRRQLRRHIHEPGAPQIIRRAISDLHYIAHLRGYLQQMVVNCYVAALKGTYITSFVLSGVAWLLSFTVREPCL
ncbi:efflux pump antibiotic resistance protein [Aspergillus steynii IBT 23096]|uniref:Efflux pump antibiotic resistance protein n=1 Tax=Aspergillus steynii IBT 23096 TaxID=1392250 RepID=A0A2I2GKD8_9EURO|nr:efflux pump antibiotic resistance protein [Aspergillus steynii IBT 23096]PLB53344.1 efflux pump antibiotic resistance protein [Aspergillus steynii IBT 23096]